MDVQPGNQNIDSLFSNTTYFIDFYQRQYKWSTEPVERLLDDVFYRFNEQYQLYKDSDLALDQVIHKYNWYYLNTYVTNKSESNGKLYIVDGQQRLTTITLILINLLHKAKKNDSELSDWVQSKIVGQSGFKKNFWMNHEAHLETMKGLLEGLPLENIDISTGITAKNMVDNYKVIDRYMNKELISKQKLESFIFYFLLRLVLIKLHVEQTDVPMVFEVINDRGVKLKPYEILKGKLLGQVDKEELDALDLNGIWDNAVDAINEYGEDEIDEFFIYYLRSKFANTIGESRKYDKNYHRIIFQGETNEHLKLLHNQKRVKEFLTKEFAYYTKLYYRILDYSTEFNEEYRHVFYNNLNEMDTQFLLILSSCQIDDPDEDAKIKTISQEVDRMFCLLQLQRSWDSNDFSIAIFKISSEIRSQSIEQIKITFEKHLKELLGGMRGVDVEHVFTYPFFKDTGMELGKRFKRYFFARVEEFISKHTNMQMRHNFYDLVQNTGTVNGFHIEHILANNTYNIQEFGEDEELFESERNRLGGLLLLKGKDNISSNNETYEQKLSSYANTLYWNETLREDTYKSKLDFDRMMKEFNLAFRPMISFGKNELEERHKLLFDIASIIWK